MRRALLLALFLGGLLAPAAPAATPTTVGEGRFPHVANEPTGTGHVVWSDETGKLFHCRLPRPRTGCDPLTTLDIGARQAAPFLLIAPDGTVHIAMAHDADEKTYLWTSTDGGRTFGPRRTIYGWGGGDAATEPVLGPQPGQITFAASNRDATVWSAAIDGSEAAATGRATLKGAGDVDFQVAPTQDGGLVAVGNDQQSIGSYRMAPGGDPSDQAAWSAASPVGFGDTSRIAGGFGGTYQLNTVGPTGAHMNLRYFSGSTFGTTIQIDEYGFVTDIVVGPSGAVAAIWRVNNPNGNRLRLALSQNFGRDFDRFTIAVEDSIMAGMDVTLAQDDHGLAVYESDHPTNTARRLIRVSDLGPVDAVSPNPPSIRRRTGSVPGATLRLDVPGACVELDSSFVAALSAKKKGGNRSRFAKLIRVDFFLGAVRLRRDRRKPFLATFSTDDLVAKKTYTVRAVAKGTLKSGRKVTKSISARVQAC